MPFTIDTAFTYPALDHDAMMWDLIGTRLDTRMKIERQVVWDLCAHLQRAGFVPCKVWDGADRTNVCNAKQAMELLFNLDEGTLYFMHAATTVKESVFFFFGNDGWDCVADMSCGREAWDAATNSFDFDQYDIFR